MGVYIKGMKMPKNCEECPCSYWTEGVHHDYCQAVGYDTEIHYGEKDRPQWCPLTEVPEPHGRLIDADVFAAEMKKRQEEAEKWLREAKDRETAVRADAVLSFLCEVKLTLDAVPTIIEAEGDSNEGRNN